MRGVKEARKSSVWSRRPIFYDVLEFVVKLKQSDAELT